jgi:hypothetical protein
MEHILIRKGNVFKLGDSMWIASDVTSTHISAISFSHENCSAIFRLKSTVFEAACHCNEHFSDECKICGGSGSYMKKIKGIDEAEFLANCVKDYIENRLLNSFYH